MSSQIESIISTALSYVPINSNFVFTCEQETFVISHHTITALDLAKYDARLPEVCTYLHKHFGALGQKATNSLRLTLEHWNDPTAARSLGGLDFRSTPRAIEPAHHPECVILTADLYGLLTLPSGVMCAFGRQYGYSSLHDKAWMEKNYPGAIEKMQHLQAIGEFSPTELAKLVFANNTAASVDMSGFSPY